LNGTTLTVNSTNTSSRHPVYFIKKIEVLAEYQGHSVQFVSHLNGVKTIYKHEIVQNNGTATPPSSNPTSTLTFLGWSLDGVNIVNVNTVQITKYTVFIARWQTAAA